MICVRPLWQRSRCRPRRLTSLFRCRGGQIGVTEAPFSASTVGKKIAEVENETLPSPGQVMTPFARCPGRVEVVVAIGSEGEARVAREGKDIDAGIVGGAVRDGAVRRQQKSCEARHEAKPGAPPLFCAIRRKWPEGPNSVWDAGRRVENRSSVRASLLTLKRRLAPSTRLRCPPSPAKAGDGFSDARDVYGCPSGAGEGRKADRNLC